MNFLSLVALAVASLTPIPVILDTDIGDDIDDTWALCMMLGDPRFDVKLVVTAADNTEVKTRLLAKIMEAVGRTDVPIGQGKKTSDQAIHQQEWLGDYTIEKYPGKVFEDGIEAMINLLKTQDKPMPLCVIGPQTNIAEALRRAPEIATKARIYSMAGSVHIGYNGAPKPDPEWNVFKDIEAARAVFAAPWEIILAPLDTCGTLILRGAEYQRVAESTNPLARVTIENYDKWANRKGYPEGESSVLFDTLAVYLCVDESAVEMETVKLRIDDRGATVIDEEGGRPVRCALRWRDKVAVEKAIVEPLTTPK